MSLYKQKITHPPLRDRSRILNQYNKDISILNVDRIDALVKYKNTMSVLYKKYNPSLQIRFVNRSYWDNLL